MRIERIFNRAVSLFDGDHVAARQWLETAIPALGDKRPLDVAQTESGTATVEDLIGRIEHGIVA